MHKLSDKEELSELEHIMLQHAKYVYYGQCEHCKNTIYAIWDEYNEENWWPYLGCQARRKNVYTYSKVIQNMTEFYEGRGLDWRNNQLLNSFTRVHSSINDPDKDSLRMENSMILCNECFSCTFRRWVVKEKSGILRAISVVEDWNETLEGLMKQLAIEGEIIGKGSLNDYR